MSTDPEQRPEMRDAGRDADEGEGREAMAPGDEAPPGDAGAGENVCRTCGGSGEVGGQPCDPCGGTGVTTSAVSGGA